MKEKNNISVILPIHSLNDDDKKLLDNAIKSVTTQIVIPDELIIVVPKDSDVVTYIKSLEFGDFKNVVIAENAGDTDYATQVNFGVSVAKSEWVSVLEYDDEYAKIWFDNVIKYRLAHKDVEVFMPIVIDVDPLNQFMGFTNEAVWAQSFSDELGVLDNNALLNYQNFSINGMVIKKDVFTTLGGIKSSIKLTFIYEFLLRLTFKSIKIMVIPKFGYKHMNQRVGSLFHTYKETMDPVEAKWWLMQAKKEYYFINDRNITYQNEQTV